MPADHLLVVAVDGLRAAALGAYGNTSFATPNLDRLAAESFLLDCCYSCSADLPLVYRALWQAVHPLRTDFYAAARRPLAEQLAARGYATTLVTDEPLVSSLGTTASFDRCIQLPEPAFARAEHVAQTSFGQLLAAACDGITQSAGGARSVHPQLVWIHSRGLYGPWDAPLDLQLPLLDEDDPAPRDDVSPPDFWLGEEHDPDTVFLHGCAYAAQVVALDACFAALMKSVESSGADRRWLVALVGVRGFPLGEHGRIGGVDDRLYVEQLHVPWLLRLPDGTGQLGRSRGLVTHVDLLPTLLDWVGDDTNTSDADGYSVLPIVNDSQAAVRDALLAASGSSVRSLRAPRWSLCHQPAAVSRGEAADLPPAELASRDELYVRPDDRWEANDVAELCPEVVVTLAELADEATRQVKEGRPVATDRLADTVRSTLG